ncbi:OmpA family protein [Paracoccus saliphilus]|uniref:OmpA family protein n=1 Tax=Paracoccus saliphilus TaxID=405559 RepID=A0AA46A5R7_9RHOB|nr:OmpA family protein [Paracoccus saliphilus]WCR04123.1 OmpA family protein [Paracoccus saliphilus]SIS85288.1 Outer membrane protein OmpA [Paracoccus saliphilus]
MRRIIHNSTAIAACLSLLAPHLAMAQTHIPDDMSKKRSEFDVIAQADTEIELPIEEDAAGQTDTEAEASVEAETAEQTDAETEASVEAETAEQTDAETEAPVEAETAEQTDAETEAPVEAETAEQTDAETEAPVEAETTEQTDAEAEEPIAGEEAPAAKPAKAAEQAAEKDGGDVTQDDARPAPKGKQGQEKAEESQPNEEVTEQEEQAPAADAASAPESSETADEDALAKALAEQEETAEDAPEDASEPETETEADADAQSETEAEADVSGEVRLTDSEAAAKRSENMSGLSKVLQGEAEAGMSVDQLTCLSGAAYPCTDGGPVMTPRGVVLEAQEDGSFMLARARDQMYRVNKEGELVQRAAEEGGVETEAAKEAATATEAPTASALTAESGEGEVVEQEVTEENSRSSAEDFETNLRDALSADADQDSQEQTAGSDDDDNDLTKALLLGLGAVAVGSMLNNNREVALSSPDRVVVTRADGSQEVIKDEVALLRQPGSTVSTENFDDGSSRTVVTRSDGSKIVTIRDADLRVLRRTLVSVDGNSTQLIDDTTGVEPVNIAELPDPAAPVQTGDAPLDEEQLRAALQREANIDRRFTLGQIRNIPEVRALVAPVNIDAITFETGSAAIKSDQAKQLSMLGKVIQQSISENPREMFLIEGHTDTVGDAAMNLALSDRRAESVALALSEYFDVPPENLVVQGYGEQYLKIRAEGDIRSNRRASVRRITELLQTSE